MRTSLVMLSLSLVTLCSSLACGSRAREPFSNEEGAADDDGAIASSGAPGSSGTPAIPDSNQPPSVNAGPGKTTLRGVTYAPNGTLPLAGVLVYETDTPPAPIPDHVYCDSCRELPEGTFVQSGADGSFELMGHAGVRYLVVEKGQFRRVRTIEVGPDGTVQDLDDTLTTLPGRTQGGNDGESDTVPRIGLMKEHTGGDNDPIHRALLALGVEEWIDFEDDLGKVNDSFLQSLHIALFPCDGLTQNKPRSSHRQALRNFAQAGGKIYASDWSHQFVDEAFGEFFRGPNRVWGYDTGAQAPKGRFDDTGLRDWLAAVSPGEDPNDTRFEGVWSTSIGVKAAEVPDANGTPHMVTPHVFASVTDNASHYPSKEAALSVEFGCGRALLSTFHVHGGNSQNLLMQEKALLYMLLDVSTCIGDPGKGGPVIN